MTPEGLNTRLTFLQQCMRPGDTIPTIKTVGQTNELQYNNATNTAFGAPTVLVLRIGDFYNTKIIPTSNPLLCEIAAPCRFMRKLNGAEIFTKMQLTNS